MRRKDNFNFQACIARRLIGIADGIKSSNNSKQGSRARIARWLLGPILCLPIFGIFAHAESLTVPAYQVGETARVDVVTPVSLMVVDRAGTEVLRAREGRKIPPFFCYYPGAANEAEANLRGTFGFTREEFLEFLEVRFKKRQLAPAACARPPFVQFVNAYKNKNRIFPLSTNLAQIWATGQPDEACVAQWAAILRQAMDQYIRPDAFPPEARSSTPQMRLVTLPNTNTVLQLEAAERQSSTLFRSNLVALSKARKDLQSQFSPEEVAVGKFLALFVKENCRCDPALTRQARARQTESVWAAGQYQPGQVIVRSGEVVTAQTKEALDQLWAKIAFDTVKAPPTAASIAPLGAGAIPNVRPVDFQNRWLVAGVILALAFSLFAVWRVRKGQRARQLLPVRIGHAPASLQQQGAKAVLSCPSCAETIVLDLPVVRAEQAAAAEEPERLAAASAGQPRGWVQRLITKAVRGLLWQRALLLDTERLAEMELTALEKRLAKMHAPLQERIAAYEKRVADLEKKLVKQQRENAAIIQAQIALTRQKLERERQGSSPVPK